MLSLSNVAETSQDVNAFFEWLQQLVPKLLDFGWAIILVIIIYIIGRKVIHWVLRLNLKYLEKTSLEPTSRILVNNIIKVALYLVLVTIMLRVVGYETTSVFALIGSAGLSIGLAFQGTLSNIAAGMLIMMTKPFRIGDYISEDTHKNEGTVKEIGIIYTTLIALDHKTIIVPNSFLTTASLINYTSQGTRQIIFKVGISYRSDMLKAKEVLKAALQDLPFLLPEYPVEIFVDELADSAVVMGGLVYVSAADYLKARRKGYELIKLALDREGIAIPFPQMDVHMIGADS